MGTPTKTQRLERALLRVWEERLAPDSCDHGVNDEGESDESGEKPRHCVVCDVRRTLRDRGLLSE